MHPSVDALMSRQSYVETALQFVEGSSVTVVVTSPLLTEKSSGPLWKIGPIP